MHLIKKSLSLISIFFITSSTFAQKSYKEMMDDMNYNFYEVVEAAEKYFEKNPSGKGSGYKPYMRWKNENEPKYYPSGDRLNVDYYLSKKNYQCFLAENANAQSKKTNNNGWIDLGPYSSFWPDGRPKGIGRIETIWVNPTNDQHIFFGSKSGGFWKTTNGGNSWKNTTDFLVSSGVNCITVNPNNFNEVLISVRSPYYNISYGIYRSLDGGETWTESNFNPVNIGFGVENEPGSINKVVYHPAVQNLVFVCSNKGIFKSVDNLNTWTSASIASSSAFAQSYSDIDFHPTNNNIIYVAYEWSSNFILKSINQGNSFVETGEFIGNQYQDGFISTSAAAPNNLWFASKNGIWKSIDSGLSFTFVVNPNENCEEFVVSDLDAKQQIYGYVDIHASLGNSNTFTKTTSWINSGSSSTYVHADLRSAICVNGVFYIGTDGYLAKSTDGGNTWTRLNEYHTSIRENYAFGIGQSDFQTIIGGSQDNGTSIYKNGVWSEFGGGDGIEAVVHPLNDDWMIGSYQNGGRIKKTPGAQPGATGISDSNYGEKFFLDPNDQMKLYNFGDRVYVSKEFGLNSEAIGSPPFNSGNSNLRVYEAAIAYNNSKIIAVASHEKIKLSKDGGYSWSSIESNLPGLFISDIAFSPKNDNIIIVTYNSFDNTNPKAYITYNLGASWSDISYNLQNTPIRTVIIDNTNENNIYLGGEIGVYTKPMNGTNWTLYNQDLPNVTIQEFDINYGTNEIFATTWGRGYWKADLVGRSTHPKILTTDITDAPTDTKPEVGSYQIVTCTIDYEPNLSKVEVRWSVNNLSFSNTINMSYNPDNNTWVSDYALPTKNPEDKVYFKVFATGNNNDISETYKFMYEVRGECNSETFSETGSEFKGENNNDLLGFYADFNADGNRIVMGSHKYDYEGGIDNGLVQVFDQINEDWVQVGNDIAGSYKSELGTNVSISSNGKRLAVGYKFDLDYTKVYELNGAIWSQLGNTIYSNSGEVKLSGDGNTLITSEWSDDTFGNNFGIVNVFEFDGANWNAKGNVSRTTTNSVGFGQSIDISSDGNRIAVKSNHKTLHTGIVNIFAWNRFNRSWYSYGSAILGNEQMSNFGESIAMNEDGSAVAISAGQGNSAVYKLASGNIWQQVGGLIDPSFILKNWSKIDISGDGKTVLLSNPTETVNGNSNFGAVARYKLENENWNKTGNTIYGNTTNKHFGINAAMSKNGKVTIIGGFNIGNKGYAKIYRAECEPETIDYCGRDANTLLFLPFDDTFDGIDGETPLSSTAVDYITGKYNKGLSGASSLKYLANNNINAQKGTVEAWVKPTWNGNDGKGHILMQYGDGGGLVIMKDGANNLRLILNLFSPSGYPEIDISKNIADWQANQWKHVAFTWGNGKLQLYIDGTPVSPESYPVPLYPINDAHFSIGKGNGGLNWEGGIDHLRISNEVRSENEINNFMNGCTGTKLAHQSTIEIYNYPNPFDKQTTISYTLPEDSPVTLTVYNGMGKQIELLSEQETMQAGRHFIDFNGSNYPPGIYYYTLKAGDYIETQKMILMR